MRENLSQIAKTIEEKSRIGFIFKKKSLVQFVNSELANVEQELQLLETTLDETAANLEQVSSDYANFKDKTNKEILSLNGTIKDREQSISNLNTEFSNFKSDTKQKLEKASNEYTDLKQKTDNEILSLNNTVKERDQSINNLNTEFSNFKADTKQKLEKASNEYTDLKQKTDNEILSLNGTIKERDQSISHLKTEFSNFKADSKQKLEKANDEYADLKQKTDNEMLSLNNIVKERDQSISNLNTEFSNFKVDTKQKLEKAAKDYAYLESKTTEKIAQLSHSIQEKDNSISTLNTEFDQFKQDSAKELAQKDQELAEEKAYAEKEYARLLEKIDDERAVTKFIAQLGIGQEKDVDEYAFKKLFSEMTKIAVGGGFSAGKSEFISSFFLNDSMKLSVGIEPTTAIPTCIVHSAIDNVYGIKNSCELVTATFSDEFNRKMNSINLTKIKPNLHLKLNHNLLQDLDINLKNYINTLVVETPLKYENICFLDTPGYNPANSSRGFTNNDVNIAKEMVKCSQALLWLIGLDTNGTISETDLNFLQGILAEKEDLPIYIVVTKADLRHIDDIEDIVDEIEEQLDLFDIPIQGISAYSAVTKTEYLHKQRSLDKFLAQASKQASKQVKSKTKQKARKNI